MATKLDIVTLEDVKNFLKTDDIPEHDDQIERLIASAVDTVENYTNWRLWQREEVINTSASVYEVFQYPYTFVSAKDKYNVDVSNEIKTNPLRDIVCFSFYSCSSPVTVKLMVGFSTSNQDKIPEPFRDTIKRLVTYSFENRDGVRDKQVMRDILAELDEYRRFTYF